jgi:hypothetical protein
MAPRDRASPVHVIFEGLTRLELSIGLFVCWLRDYFTGSLSINNYGANCKLGGRSIPVLSDWFSYA